MKGVIMKKSAVICLLTLCFAVSGVAQHPSRVSQIQPVETIKRGLVRLAGKGNTVCPHLKKAVAYVGLSIMLCVSCDDAKHQLRSEARKNVQQAEITEQRVIEIASQQIETTANEDGSWYRAVRRHDHSTETDSMTLPNANGKLIVYLGSASSFASNVFHGVRPHGVYRQKQPDTGIFDYYPIELYDEMGEFLPDALQVGWDVLYEKGGRYFSVTIDSISEDGLRIRNPEVTIDASQVRGVLVVGSNPYYGKEVVFPAEHALPYEDTDLVLLTEADDIYFHGIVYFQYTKDIFSVWVKNHGRHLSPSHISIEKEYPHYGDGDNYVLVKEKNLIFTVMED